MGVPSLLMSGTTPEDGVREGGLRGAVPNVWPEPHASVDVTYWVEMRVKILRCQP